MLVKVWNDNVHPFTQNYHDVLYKIPAKKYIEIDEEEADSLLKAFSQIKVDYDGNAKPESYKMLRIDEDDRAKIRSIRENKAKSGSYICQACGYVAGNKWELNGHIMELHKQSFEDSDKALESLAKDQEPKRKRG
tara:strand:- start:595 stop:999 length:405 start_codon:yes stop_codon:yes gene_type:complete